MKVFPLLSRNFFGSRFAAEVLQLCITDDVVAFSVKFNVWPWSILLAQHSFKSIFSKERTNVSAAIFGVLVKHFENPLGRWFLI